ncbi:hypothetical protein [Roseimaritima ulvae]|uniref:Glycosyltransferase RgtA/B/C/D-like domain-containing protein n=1 Tax=Roseimaritima ulvae TaxID=980254 RepID=A0A5B9QUQ0_9BACT|nr:hypothetical protein [Roseimaritima ulvae]QEG42758.1 hypothetical protein UC8_48000 [Roseimaritima ulvae]
MSSKKAKKPIKPNNADDRSSSNLASSTHRTTPAPPVWPSWRTRAYWGALAVGALWCGLYLLAPQWPADMLAANAEGNGPRWFLLLAPDSNLEGWIAGRVTLTGLLERLAVLLPAAIVVVVAWFAGRLVLRAAPPLVSPSRLETITLAIVTGLSLHSLMVLAVGLAGGVGRWWSGPLVAGLTIGVAYGAARFLRRIHGSRSRQTLDMPRNHTSPAWPYRLGCVVVVALAMLSVARSMLPPAEYDVREYHLQAPKEWSEAGRITFLPHNIYTAMPMGAEMQVLATMDWWRIGNAESAWWWGALSGKVLIGGFALLTALLAGLAVRRVAGRTSGIWTVALALAMPAMIEGATLGLIEAAVACFFAAGLLLLVAALHGQTCGGAVPYGWVGFFAGSALACKYPALVFVVLPLGIACWFGNPTLPVAQRLRGLAWFAIAVAVAGGPWLVKNWVWTGNPVYPLAANVFGGRTMDEAKIAQWNRGHETGDYSLRELAVAAERVSWKWKSQSLMLVPLALLAVVGAWDRRETRYAVLGVVLSVLLWWMLTHRIARFLVPSLPLLFILAGIGWGTLRERLGIRTAVAVAFFGVLINGLMISSPLMGDVRIAVDLSALRTDHSGDSGISRLAEHVRYVNEYLAADDRLLAVGDAAVFDFIPHVDYATTFDQSPLTAITDSVPEPQWPAAFKEAGWTHVLVHWGEIERLRSTYGFDERITPELFARLQQAGVLRLQRAGLTGGNVELYEVHCSAARNAARS